MCVCGVYVCMFCHICVVTKKLIACTHANLYFLGTEIDLHTHIHVCMHTQTRTQMHTYCVYVVVCILCRHGSTF